MFEIRIAAQWPFCFFCRSASIIPSDSGDWPRLVEVYRPMATGVDMAMIVCGGKETSSLIWVIWWIGKWMKWRE